MAFRSHRDVPDGQAQRPQHVAQRGLLDDTRAVAGGGVLLRDARLTLRFCRRGLCFPLLCTGGLLCSKSLMS